MAATIISSSKDLQIYNHDKNLKIYAGPGAGKTHLLIENIKAIVKNSVKLKNSHRKILCITYTNAAVDEIVERLGSYNQYVAVHTIHAFINKYIIDHNQIQLRHIISNEFGIGITKKLASVQEGYNVLSGKSTDEVKAYILENYADVSIEDIEKLTRTKMLEVEVDIKDINKKGPTDVEQTDLKYDPKKMDNSIALAIKEFIWNESGKLTFNEILYFGYRILEKYPLATYMIQAEFPYILLDEYQDTNPIQNKMIKIVSKKESIIGVVGDIAQSIYSFQGATYEEFKDFSLESKYSTEDYVITSNRRSTQNIIHFLNYIRKNDKTLNNQTCEQNLENNDLVTFVVQKDRAMATRPLLSLLKQDTRILCRKWSEAFSYIDSISAEQKKLLNDLNSVYTFRLNKNLETELEAKQEIWIKTMIDIVELEDAYIRKCIPSVMDKLDNYIDLHSVTRNFNESNHTILTNCFKILTEIFSDLDDAMLLKDLIISINALLDKYQLPIKEYFKYPLIDSEEYFESVYKLIDNLEYKTAKKIVKEIFSEDSKYMTIHKSKGREFDSILVNMEPFQRGEEKKIKPYEMICNPVIFRNDDNKNEVYEEYTRIMYVAFSRAINKLYIHIFGDEVIVQEIDRALELFCEEQGIEEKFYEFEFC